MLTAVPPWLLKLSILLGDRGGLFLFQRGGSDEGRGEGRKARARRWHKAML